MISKKLQKIDDIELSTNTSVMKYQIVPDLEVNTADCSWSCAAELPKSFVGNAFTSKILDIMFLDTPVVMMVDGARSGLENKSVYRKHHSSQKTNREGDGTLTLASG
jgi:hypothetical protein